MLSKPRVVLYDPVVTFVSANLPGAVLPLADATIARDFPASCGACSFEALSETVPLDGGNRNLLCSCQLFRTAWVEQRLARPRNQVRSRSRLRRKMVTGQGVGRCKFSIEDSEGDRYNYSDGQLSSGRPGNSFYHN
jgi:hypothetical protein